MGQGIIRVAQQVFEDLNRPFQFEAWHESLLLPDTFRVVDARCNPLIHGHNDHYVTVESDAIPKSAIHPGLELFHGLDHDIPFLIRIEMNPGGSVVWSRE